jgi:invasion protein IalB
MNAPACGDIAVARAIRSAVKCAPIAAARQNQKRNAMNGFARLVATAAVALLAGAPSAHAVEGAGRTQTAQAPPARPAPPRAPAAAPAAPPAPAAQAPAAPPAPGAAAQPAAPPPIPSRTEILNFENWVVTCNEFETSKTRVCSALLQIAQQNTNQVVFAWTVALDNTKQMVTIMQTPTGVNIPPGIELRVGKVPPHKIPFASCDTGRCVATSPMDANLLREMTTAPTAEAIIQGSQGNTVQFNIQMKGFDKAYAVLTRS